MGRAQQAFGHSRRIRVEHADLAQTRGLRRFGDEGVQRQVGVNDGDRVRRARRTGDERRQIDPADDAIPPRYATTYFAHVFSGGYDAGYYSYIWSEVLDADTVEWFREHGGLTRENGERFRQRLLGVGASKDPLEAFRDFRGRDARIEPLLARRGLE